MLRPTLGPRTHQRSQDLSRWTHYPRRRHRRLSSFFRILILKEVHTILVLQRYKNEAIVINNNIEVVVVEIRGDRVRLGINAPKEIPIHRREVQDAIDRQAAEAALLFPDTQQIDGAHAASDGGSLE